jgi:DNA-binding winged helix-turn-helix (wHTH) protein/Tol biopolymer transport system component
MTTLQHHPLISFGMFQIDVDSGELRRHGLRIKLQSQPFRALVVLLSRPGEVITREELQNEIWGSNTSVDFERGLASAINKLREALGDSAENPRFVETLARRGYRFIAPVTVTAASTQTTSSDEASSVLEEPQSHRGQLPAAEERVPLPSPFPPVRLAHASESAQAMQAPVFAAASRRKTPWSRREVMLTGVAIVLFGILLASWFRGQSVPEPPVRIVQLTRNSLISSGPPNMESLLTLVADGDRLLTSMLIDGEPQLASLDLSTAALKPVPLPAELASATLCDISKDSSHLLLRGNLSSRSEQPLWVVPTAGGSAMRLGNVLAHAATWMPDGNNILVASGDDLAIVQADSGSVTPYVKLPGRAFSLRWSPDGRLLRLTLMNPSTHTSSLWELHQGSHTAQPLLRSRMDRRFVCCGTWTADGKAYVFQASDNFASDLWELRGDGARATLMQLTNGPVHFSSPTAARSGSQIFFFGADPPMGLQQYAGEQVGFRPAQAFLANANRVVYSRDGRWVAWTDPVGKLWRARASDGSERLQLTPDYLDTFLAQWSPDGSRLAIMARAPGRPWQIYLVNKDGGNPETLFKDARNAADPSWSANGQQLVYGREPDTMGQDSGLHTIAIFDLASRQTETLPLSRGLFSPRWSPDGKWIAALTLDQKKVMLFDVAQKSWTELATTSASDPIWSHDSKALFVHAFMAVKQPILRIAVPEGATQVVAGTEDFHDGEPANYFFGGLTPNDLPLVQPRVGTGNLYLMDLSH